jgi:hypothetical protein
MCAETDEELCMYEQECAVTVGSPGWDGMMEDGRRLRLSRVLVRRWAASRMRPRDLEVTAARSQPRWFVEQKKGNSNSASN